MNLAGDRTLTIGTFARRSRLSAKALRLYDRLGLLSPAQVDARNGYRLYLESQLEIARLVVSLRRLEMPLNRVAAVVAAPPAERADLVEAYWAEVEARLAVQRQLAAHLRIRLAGTEGKFDMYEILQRDVPDERVLTEQRHTTVEGLPAWIQQATHRLYTAAAELGLDARASFVIYHGEVTEDSDGPVEVCVPFAATPTDAPLAEHANRIEPAHREAYTRITVAQVGFPQILSAYDAVEKWIQTNAREIVGSPREIYFGDWSRLGPNDDACDIAFPIAFPTAAPHDPA